MRQLSCKRLITFFLINICFLTLSVQAQDSTKTSTQPVKKTAPPTKAATSTPAKAVAQPPAKTVTPPVKPVAKTTINPPAKIVSSPPTQAVSVDNSSLNGQYEALLKHSWMQQGYKVVNPSRLTNLWKSVNDTLISNKKELAEARKKMAEQAKQINEFKNPNASKENAQEKSVTSVNQLQILGTSIDISTYNWIVWGTILTLALGLAAVLFTTTKNSIDARQHRQQYEEISSEYQAYKAKAKEKELKLARELQTERNTIEELLEKRNGEEPIKKGKK